MNQIWKKLLKQKKKQLTIKILIKNIKWPRNKISKLTGKMTDTHSKKFSTYLVGNTISWNINIYLHRIIKNVRFMCHLKYNSSIFRIKIIIKIIYYKFLWVEGIFQLLFNLNKNSRKMASPKILKSPLKEHTYFYKFF